MFSIMEILTYLGLFLISCVCWLPIYKHIVSKYVTDATIARIESGQIDLNYLLDEGGVFDSLATRTVALLKQHMVAEMGQLSYQSKTLDPNNADPMTMGIDAAGELLKMVGMKRPPAMLQMKVAQALGQLAANQATPNNENNFDPSEEFFKQ